MEEKVRVFHLKHDNSSSSVPVAVSKVLIVNNDYTWCCQVNGLTVPHSCSTLSSVPDVVSIEDFSQLLKSIMTNSVCPGNDDGRFVKFCELKNGKLLSVTRTVVAFLNKSDLEVTVRHTSCDIFVVNGKRCSVCTKYRSRLRSMISSFERSKQPLSKTQSICTPQQKIQRKSLRKRIKNLAVQNRQLTSQLHLFTERSGIDTDAHLHNDLMAVVANNQGIIDRLSKNNFQRIFWEQQ